MHLEMKSQARTLSTILRWRRTDRVKVLIKDGTKRIVPDDVDGGGGGNRLDVSW
jgi:hypothetical protein